jgi:hypothetical protein
MEAVACGALVKSDSGAAVSNDSCTQRHAHTTHASFRRRTVTIGTVTRRPEDLHYDGLQAFRPAVY